MSMADCSPLSAFYGYESKTIAFKWTADGDVLLDVLAPKVKTGKSVTVLLHYHGGFLVIGNRYAFLPYWLVNACVTRGWVFVTPDYRLLPESTAHDTLEDALEAYTWVLKSLPSIIGTDIESVVLARSSAGAYLALTTATRLTERPSALLLIYGMLDATQYRYTTAGANIFGRPAIETASVLAQFPLATEQSQRRTISTHPLSKDLAVDPRSELIAALHVDALFPDYMAGIAGMTESIARYGIDTIPKDHQILFPLAFSKLSNVPTTILLHGRSDSAVPVSQSEVASEKLSAAGVTVHTVFPDDAEHGFDARAGNVNVEAIDCQSVASFRSLRKVLKLLDAAVEKKSQALR
ncbi:alpha/beta-hydrolase [Pyrenochaeta sp. DS3sAY3a]|nr:alpha/beta-hydrolase [Pyrenochaeta sp. DS3sAY3a]